MRWQVSGLLADVEDRVKEGSDARKELEAMKEGIPGILVIISFNRTSNHIV